MMPAATQIVLSAAAIADPASDCFKPDKYLLEHQVKTISTCTELYFVCLSQQ
jgi:hypothetical protein